MSIADKLTYLQTTKQLLKTEINKINNVLTDESTFRSYPQELFNGYLDILNNGTDTLWNNLEKVSQTGTEAVLENVETAPIKMVLNGNTSQDGEPTPDTPVEVKVVKGENVVSVQGKNSFDKNNANVVNVYANNNIFNSGWRYSTIYIPCTPNTTYTISREVLENNFVAATSVEVPVANGSYTNRMANSTGTEITITSGASDRYLSVYIKYEGDTSYTLDEILSTLQIEEGSTATEYEEYKGANYPISLGKLELCKIRNYKDYLFKRNDKWFKHNEIGKVVLDGSEENWFQSGNYFRIQISNSKSGTNCRSNYFVAGNQDNQFFVYADNYLGFRYGVLNNILADWKTWLSTHNTIVYYVLATPTEEEITNTTLIEQLEAISKAKSVKDKTYITQTNDELPFILDVEAIKEYTIS